jgi:HK97 family phage prohead protease
MDTGSMESRPVRRSVPSGIQYREVRAAEITGPDTLSVVASDETVDRYGDVLRVSGWDLSGYKKNPIVLFAHEARYPVGTSKVRIDGKQLIADITLAEPGTSDIVDAVRALVRQKILKAVSVGFQPTKEPNEIKDPDTNKWTGGYEFVGQELLENSIVSIPANPNALTLARSFSPAVRRALFQSAPGRDVQVARAQIAVLRLGVADRQSS